MKVTAFSILLHPPKNFYGIDEFSLNMDEGDKSSELNFKITVEPVPDKPEFITSFDQLITLEEGVEFQQLIEAYDPDGETVTFQLISPVWDLDPWASIIENDADGKFYITGTPKWVQRKFLSIRFLLLMTQVASIN